MLTPDSNKTVEVSARESSPAQVIPAVLLHQLLLKLGMAADLLVLTAACAKAGHLSAANPGDQARYILTQAQLKGVLPVQLMWHRLDLHRLPALVWFDDQWSLAERVEAGTIRLTGQNGRAQEIDDATLRNALVIWLRATASRSKSVTPKFRNNQAAHMVWRELFRDSSWVMKVVIATIIINTIAIATSLFAMQVYDRVVPTMAYATLTTLVAGMAIILSLDWCLKVVRARILDSVSVTVDKQVSQQVFDHLLHLRLDVQPKSLGTLAAQVSGLDTVRQFFTSGVIFGLIDLPFTLLFIAVIAVIGGKVGWVYASLLPIALILGFVTQLQLRDLMLKQMMRTNERQGVLVDAIRGAESIRSSNATWRFSEEWKKITASIDGYNIQQRSINNLSNVTTNTLSNIAYVVAVVVGVWQVELGQLTMGGMIACSILGGRVIAPIAQGIQYLAQWQGVSQALQMVNQVLDLDLERRAGQTLLLPEQMPESIELDRVRFAYPDSPVQQITIPKVVFHSGERILLVGPVGCGKSTLLKVMAGLYRPNEGRIRLGDADLWEVDPQLVTSQTGYLPQMVHLFKGTLRSNLTLSGTGSDSKFLKVIRALGVDAIAANNPLGMDLLISEGGDGLSGGQRQLVALSRVIIGAPRIWLLDEPTASLDAESEEKVWAVLEEFVMPEDILIMSTHRPMLGAKLATRVILMQQGEIIKDGTPEQVIPQLFVRKPLGPRPTGMSQIRGQHNVV